MKRVEMTSDEVEPLSDEPKAWTAGALASIAMELRHEWALHHDSEAWPARDQTTSHLKYVAAVEARDRRIAELEQEAQDMAE